MRREACELSFRQDLLELDSVKIFFFLFKKSLFKLRLSSSLAAFAADTNPEEKMREGSSYLTGMPAACILASPGC